MQQNASTGLRDTARNLKISATRKWTLSQMKEQNVTFITVCMSKCPLLVGYEPPNVGFGDTFSLKKRNFNAGIKSNAK